MIDDFAEALQELGQRKTVTCVMDGGNPVVYKVVAEELTVNGTVCDIRDFCFSPSQILFGKWTIETKEG